MQNLLPVLLLVLINSGCLNNNNFGCGFNKFNRNCRDSGFGGNNCRGNGFFGNTGWGGGFLGNNCCGNGFSGNNCCDGGFLGNNCGCEVPNRSSCYFRPHCNNWWW